MLLRELIHARGPTLLNVGTQIAESGRGSALTNSAGILESCIGALIISLSRNQREA